MLSNLPCHQAAIGGAVETTPCKATVSTHQQSALWSNEAKMILKKIAMLGMYGVGKTSLVKRFVSSIFDEKYHTTIGVKIDKKIVRAKDQEMTLMLWDVAGAEDHFTVPTSFIRGSAGYLLVIDGTRVESLNRGFELIAQVQSELGKIPFVAILNKIDLADRWQLQQEHLKPLTALGCSVIRSSALTGEGVEEAFYTLAEQLL
jgi:small GTP-binding protein